MRPLSLRVGILPHVRACKSLGRAIKKGEAPKYLDRMTLEEALETHFESPALFCSYYVDGEEKLPRLANADERLIKSKGGQIFISCLAIDYDRPKVDGKKSPWNDAEEPWDLLAKLSDTKELWPTVFYTTKHGARLIYVLKRAITPHEAGLAYAKLLERLLELGIEGDENTKDWTRLFALPFITKWELDDEGQTISTEPLWNNDTIFCETFPDYTLNPDVLLHTTTDFEPCVIEGQVPDANACAKLLWKDTTMTPGHKRAKELLKNNSFGAYLFDGHGCDFVPGQRDSKINIMVWTVVRSLFDRKGMEEIGPEFPYAIMQRGVAQMAPDADEPDKDWTSVLWDKTCRIWEQTVDEAELLTLSDEEIEKQAFAGWKDQLRQDGVSIQGLLARSGIKSEIALMKRHLILLSKSDCYLLDATGHYRPRPTATAGLHGAIEGMGLGRLYSLEQFGVRVTEQDLKRACGYPVDMICGKLGQENARVIGLGTDYASLLVPTYFLKPIEPIFVPVVDAWLRAFAGEHYERLADWIGHCQDVPKPICALSLTGPANVGKTFFAELIGALFGPGNKNNEHVFGQWNFNLRDNPVIHIDEDLDSLKGQRVDGKFRTFVTGGNLTLSQRNVDERSYEVYPRVIVAANELEALHAIVTSRDLGADSLDALAQRILHIEVQGDAAKLLHRDFTGNWLNDDKLALHHFSWLYANRLRPSNWAGMGRFVVEGDRHSEMLQEAQFSSPIIEAVQRTLIKAAESSGNLGEGIDIVHDEVHASAMRVSDIMTMNSQDFFHLKTSPRAIGLALRKLSNGFGQKTPTRVWYVPIEILLRYAIETGAKCDRLRQTYMKIHGENSLTALEDKDGE